MAATIDLSDVGTDLARKIVTDLTIRHEDPAVIAARRGRGAHRFIPAPPVKEYVFMHAVAGVVHIPLSYARTVLGVVDDAADETAWGTIDTASMSAPPDDFSLTDEQKPILVEAETALRTSLSGCTVIEVFPGMGKTVMAVLLAASLGYKFAVLTPVSVVVPQWTKTIDYLSRGSLRVAIPEQPAVATRSPAKVIEPDSFDAIVTLPERMCESSISAAAADAVGTLIIDEAHLACVKSAVAPLLFTSPKHIIVLTATFERNDTAHKMMELLAGGAPRIVRRMTRPYTITPLHIPKMIDATINRITGKMDYADFCNKLANCDAANAAVIDLVTVREPDKKFIILTKLVAHAHYLHSQIPGAAVLTGAMKSFPDSRVLIGTMSKIGTGFDMATACENFAGQKPEALVFFNSVKTWQNFSQMSGRVTTRAGPSVIPSIYWLTTLNKHTTAHLAGLKSYIKKTNGVMNSPIVWASGSSSP